MHLRSAVLITLLLAVLVGCGKNAAISPTGATVPRAPDPGAVLRDWDAARAAAWAAADPAALRDLYLPGSSAGRRDLRSLQAYADRGLRVTGLRMQRLAQRVLILTDARLRLEVVERLAGAVVEDGSAVRRLPTGQPVRRVIDLRRDGAVWKVASIVTR